MSAFLPFLIFCFSSPEKIRTVLKPIDFQRHEQARHYLPNLGQLESDGKHLYLASPESTEILVVAPDGSVVKTIGGRGGHPGELGYLGVYAMAVQGKRLWVVDSELKRVRLFMDGRYRSSFRLDSSNYYAFYPASNGFAFSETHIVIPGSVPGRLANAYNPEGEIVKRAGSPLRFTDELVKQIPGVNDTIWLTYGDSWLSIHKFFPMVTVYNRKFGVVSEFQIESPFILELLDGLYEFVPSPDRAAPNAIFTDAKIFRDDLYLMSGGRLHRVDLESGKVRSIMSFSGKGPDFAGVHEPELALFFFAFLEDGRLFVAHPGMLWNHDLWTISPWTGS